MAAVRCVHTLNGRYGYVTVMRVSRTRRDVGFAGWRGTEEERKRKESIRGLTAKNVGNEKEGNPPRV